jgi:hypothetical protein
MGGWLLGGTIWGWFIAGKWFHGLSVIRCFIAPAIGIFVMPIEIGRLIIAIVKLFLDRAKGKKERELAKAKMAENE